MPTAEELIVAIRSEGVGDTQDDLEGVESSMEQTADAAGESAEELQGFSEQFEGAMGAAVAALAVGAAGLLSQVPVLGELFAGLAAVVSALAFQMDGVLRPVLSPLTDFFFGLSQAIFEADGAAGDFAGIISTVVGALAVAVPVIAKVGSVLGVFASTGAGVVSVLGTIVGVIGTVVGAIASLPVALVAAVAAIVAFAAAYLTNFRGVRDKTNALVGQIVDFVVGGFNDFVDDAVNAVSGFADDVVEFFTGIADDISEWGSDLASDARGFGVDIVTALIEGLQSFSTGVVRALVGIINAVIQTINTALESLPDSVKTRLGVEQLGTLDASAITSDIPTVNTPGEGGGTRRPPGRRGDRSGLTLDGRQVTESTGRYRSDSPRRRGI